MTEVLNILWLVDHLGYNGIMHGAGKFYLNVIPNLDKSRIKVTLCVLRSKDALTSLFDKAGIETIHFNRGKFDFGAIMDLVKIVRQKKIQLIHTHGYGSDNFGRIAGFLFNIPTIVHAHDDNSNYPWHQNIADIILRILTKNAIAVSESVRESCIHKRSITPKKLTVMHNGIILNDFIHADPENLLKTKFDLGITPSAKIIGTVARLREEKGIRYFIDSIPEILKSFPECFFLIVGDGPLRETLQMQVESLGIKRKVIFTGFRTDIPQLLSIMDIFVAPSLTEGSPLGILEALSMGKAVVAAKTGGIKEILRDGENGYFVPIKNPKMIAEKVIFLLHNSNETTRLHNNALRDILNYDIIKYVENLKNFYLQLAGYPSAKTENFEFRSNPL